MPRLRRPPLTMRKLTSAISAGNADFSVAVDGRTSAVRVWRDTCRLLIEDLGGDQRISSGARILVRRLASLDTQAMLLEAKWARNKNGVADPAELSVYATITNCIRRVVDQLGISTAPREPGVIDGRTRINRMLEDIEAAP